jgi:nucleoside 2-deoxyribosyltransferase
MTICPITNLRMHSYAPGNNEFYYCITFNDMDYEIIICRSCANKLESDQFFIKNKHIAAGLLLNKKIKDKIHWATTKPDEFDLFQLLKEGNYPNTPEEKLKNLLLNIYKMSDHDGKPIVLAGDNQHPSWYVFYFKNPQEMAFYIRTLETNGLVEITHTNFKNDFFTVQLTLSYSGLSEALKLNEEGKLSNLCFIAMSFSNESKPIREAIKQACESTHYRAILIDETHFDSHQTINDAIIASLRKSKFCIADFTEQKDGVYFESGFALGQGKKVIYSCRKDWFEKSHFDTDHFPHILYETPEELKKKLIDKIEAWI